MKSNKKNKKKKIKKGTIVCLIIVVAILIAIICCFIRYININNQLISNIDEETKTTTVYCSGNNMFLKSDTYNKLKEEEIDIIVINSSYIARIENEYIQSKINLNINISNNDTYDYAYNVEFEDNISALMINVQEIGLDYGSYVSLYTSDNNLLTNSLQIDESGYVELKLQEDYNSYILAYIIPNELNIEEDNITAYKGATKELDFGIDEALYTVGSIKVTCSDEEAVTVDERSNIILNKVGEYTLYISSNEYETEVNLTVLQSVEEITLSALTLEMMQSTTKSVSATFSPDDAQNTELVWTSSDETIATVDQSGNITGLNIGVCEISVCTKEEPIVKQVIQVEVVEYSSVSSIISNNTQTEVDGITYVNGILLVNKTHSVPADYAPGLLTETYNAFLELQAAAAEAGFDIQILSGYRSYETQTYLYNNYVATYGQAEADTFSAKPGTSEHQTGLALDVGWIDDSYGDTPSGIWLAQNCYKYGFIIRYPEGKESITGYKYEPWHIRYLGKEIANDVYESGLCLEEYLGVLD